MSEPHAPTSEQLALLREAARPQRKEPAGVTGTDTTDDAAPASSGSKPDLVAVVWPMLEVPHLDREFEYTVPEEMRDDIAVGVAVKVRFKAQQITGYVVALREQAEFSGTLRPIQRVISSQVVLTPHVWELARAVAARDAGNVSDVLRLAIPPRHARAEAALDARDEKAAASEAADVDAVGETADASDTTAADGSPGAPSDGERSESEPTEPAGAAVDEASSAWRFYGGGLSLLKHIADGEGPRASWNVAPGLFGDDAWPAAVAELADAARRSKRGSLVVVPDARDVERVLEACTALLGRDKVVRLSADQGPQARYTSFLKTVRGEADVVVGTRAAMFAPVKDLGLVVWWDDTDPLHAEPHAPYPHVRDVLRERALLSGAALVSAGPTRSAAVEAWVESGDLVAVDAVARTGAAVVVTGDDRAVERHGPAARARLPAQAWRGATDALAHGPVLVQVPRRGYVPALACARCRTKAACPVCHGPLGLADEGATPTCRWCGHVAHVITCPECGAHDLRSLVVGAGRTAEELGRAFPGVPVRRSGAPDVLATVPDTPALVIATPGAEPVAENGYSAAILLDAWALLDRAGLDSSERALTHWSTAAGLVRGATDGGAVYLCGVPRHVPFPSVEALVRAAPRWFAVRELAERAEVGLPPVVRMAALEGPRRAAQDVADEVSRRANDDGVPLDVLGPLPLGRRHMFDRATGRSNEDDPKVRYLVRWNDPGAPEPPKLLRGVQAARSAAREPVVTLRLDPMLDGLA